MKTSKEELRQLAQLAAKHGFEWLAQDKNNTCWYAYKLKPKFRKFSQEWWAEPNSEFVALHLPDATDYSKQLFNVNELLTNEQ